VQKKIKTVFLPTYQVANVGFLLCLPGGGVAESLFRDVRHLSGHLEGEKHRVT